MKKQLTSLMLLIVLAAITTPFATTAQPSQTSSMQVPGEISNDTTLLFLGNMNIAPVVYLDGTTPSGVAVDIVHALAEHIPEPIEIQAMNWSEAQTLVAQGKADALIQINPTEERLKIYDFSDTLLESQFSIFTRSDKMGISGASSLRGLHVGVEAKGLPQQVLEKDPLIQLTIIPNFTEGFKQLNEGTIDAVVVDYRVGSYVLAENNIRNIKVSGEPIAFSYSSFAVKKGDTKLLNEINTALQIIKTDGTYQKILDNWKPTEGIFQTQEQITEGIYRVTILIFLILFLIAGIWMVTIKRELTKRKSAEEKLREQYSTLRGIINSGNTLIFSVDHQYRYTSFNKGHADVMKALYGAEIEIGFNILNYMTVSEDRETAKHNLDRALAGEQLLKEAYSGDELRTRQYFQVSHSPIRSEEEIIGVAVLAQDMTERKQAEEALRVSEERFRTMVEQSPFSIQIMSPDGRTLQVNKAFENLWGLVLSDLKDYNILRDDEVIKRGLMPYIQTGFSGKAVSVPPSSYDVRHMFGKGGIKWVHSRIYPIKDMAGNIRNVILMHEDISERKRADEALRMSEERLRLTLDAANDGIWDWNVPTGSAFFSPRWYTMLGYEPDELPGTYTTWRSLLHPDDLEATEQKIQDHMLKKEAAYSVEFRMRTKQGGWCWVLARGKVIERDEDGNPVRMVGTHTDISIRKRIQEELAKKDEELFASYEQLAANEEELRHNFESLTLTERTLRESEERLLMAEEIGQTGCWEYNLDTGRIWGSTETLHIYGFPPVAGYFPIGEIEACVLEREKVHQAFIDFLSGKSEYNIYITVNPADGSPQKIVHSVAKIEKDDEGNPTRVVGVIQDVTEHKRAEKELYQYRIHLEELVEERTIDLQTVKEQAEKANQAKSTFLSSMSHELRTPLNAILGFTQILIRQDNLSDTQREQLLIVKSSGDHLLNLITDLLDLGRIEAQKIEIQHSGFNLPNTIQEVMDITKVKAEEKNLTLQYEPQTLIPDHVLGDERKIKQILLNLISNAVKYTREGGIILRVWYPDISSGLFVCEVEDSGIGIPQDKLEIIFEPFTNLSSERKPIEGAGLGLSITQNLVEMMQGTLQVRSEPGKGSTFRFEVVLPSVEVSETPLITEDQITGYEGERKRVLVIDDNPENVALLVSLLKSLGFEVITACKGSEAIRVARDEIPDLILLDLVMPEMDGLDVAKIFRRDLNLKQIPIIGISATVSPSERKKEFEALCDEFVGKPIPFGELLEKIHVSVGISWNVVPSVSANQSPEESTEKERSMVVPPEQTLQVIISLVKQGMFSELKPLLTDLQTDGRYTPFCEQIHRFARNYDDERILSFIAGLKERQDYHEG